MSRLKQSRLAAMTSKILMPCMEKKVSVVQMSVEVTESSLSGLEVPTYGSLKGNTHKL